MARLPCTATKQDGDRCRAFALPAEPFCKVHHPEHAEAVRLARSRGAKVRALEGRRRRLEQPAELARFLSALCEDTLSGKVEAGTARSVAYVAQVLRGVVETSDLAERLSAQGERIEAMKELVLRGRVEARRR